MRYAKIKEALERYQQTKDESCLVELFELLSLEMNGFCRKYPYIPGTTDEEKIQVMQVAVWQAALKFDTSRDEREKSAFHYLRRVMERSLQSLLQHMNCNKRIPLNSACELTEFVPDPISFEVVSDDPRAELLKQGLERNKFSLIERLVIENFSCDDDGHYFVATANAINRKYEMSCDEKSVDNAITRIKRKVSEFNFDAQDSLRRNAVALECRS